MRRSGALAVLIISAAVLPSAAQGLTGTGDRSPRGEAALPLSDNRWPTNIIPVCWENPATAYEREMAWVRESVRQGWGANTGVDFVGWSRCTPDAKGIRLRIGRDQSRTKALGRTLSGMADGIVLGFDFRDKACSPRRYCVETVAMHAFGHALGLAHSEQTSRTAFDCQQDHPSADPVADPVFLDTRSVMRYCETGWKGDGKPSARDIQAATSVYGPAGVPLIGFSESKNGSASALFCTVPLDIQPWAVDFSRDDQRLSRSVECRNNAARSLYLRGIPAGSVLRLYDDPQGRLKDDWVEIIVKRDIDEKTMDGFERSFEDADLRVVTHPNDGLDGKVSRLQIDDEKAGAVIDLYERNAGKGRLICSVLAKYLREPLNALVLSSGDCADNRARSLILNDMRGGMVVRLFDSPKGERADDWVEIAVKRDLARKAIDSFERYAEDEDVRIRYFRKDRLDGQVSRLEVAQQALASGGLWTGLSNGTRFKTFEWANWSTNEHTKVLAGDFNADGKTDVMKFDVPASGSARLGLWVGLSDGTRFDGDRWENWHNSARMRVAAGDFNGDGRTDVMKFDVPASGTSKQGLWVGLSDGSKFNSSQWETWRSSKNVRLLAGDFDGDGLADVMKFDVPDSGTSQQGLWVGTSTGAGFDSSRWALWKTNSRMKVLAGDFNGDGKTDVLKLDPPSKGSSERAVWVGLSNGRRFNGTKWADWQTENHIELLSGDYNGDGKTDVLRLDLPKSIDGQASAWVGLSDGRSFKTARWGTWPSAKDVVALTEDFNGDGKTDLLKLEVPVRETSVSAPVKVALSDGTKFQSARWAGWLTNEATKVLVGDFNGDGMADAVKFDVPPSRAAD